jgi:large subunit ribosomal protein L21
MYAVIRTGSKQYRVSPGDVITIEKLDLEEGKKCTFEDVVLYHDGESVVTKTKELAKVKVDGRVVGQGRSKKLIVFKYKPKKGYSRKKGHRQQLTRVKIEDIIVRKSAPRARPQAAAKVDTGAAKEEESA